MFQQSIYFILDFYKNAKENKILFSENITMDSESGEKQKLTNKAHSCKTCGKALPTKSKLITHERVHTG